MEIKFISSSLVLFQLYWFVVVPSFGFLFGSMLSSADPDTPYEYQCEPTSLMYKVYGLLVLSTFGAVLQGMWWTIAPLLISSWIGYLMGKRQTSRILSEERSHRNN